MCCHFAGKFQKYHGLKTTTILIFLKTPQNNIKIHCKKKYQKPLSEESSLIHFALRGSIFINFIYTDMEVDSKPNLPKTQANQANHDSSHYLVMHGKTLKCVCELCTCGKHHCPRPRVKGNFSTSYADHYKNIQMKQAPPSKMDYKYQQRHYNPEALKTSYQDTYIQPQNNNFIDSPSRLQNIGSKIVYQVPFVGSSSYKDQYKPFEIKPSANPEQFDQRSPGQTFKPTQVKFEGVSAYKSQFIEPPKVESRPIPQATFQPMQIPFYGQSSYKNDFPQYKIQPMKYDSEELSLSRVQIPTVKFEGATSYNDQFKGYNMRYPEQDLAKSHHCAVDKLTVPPINYINDEKHIYYDPETSKFV